MYHHDLYIFGIFIHMGICHSENLNYKTHNKDTGSKVETYYDVH